VRPLHLVILLAACRPEPQASPFTLRIAVSGPLDTVDPRSEGRSWTVVARPLVFERLLSLGHTGEVVPVLAGRIDAAGPGAFRVWLRPDARFSDGSPVTVAEVTQSIAGSGLQARTEGESIVFRSEDASAPTELLLSQTFVFRREGQRTMGTGAFVVDEEDLSHILLRRLRPAPGFINRVLVKSYPTPQDAFARTLKGDADMLVEVEPRWIEFFEGVPRIRILRARANHANMVAFNPRRLSRTERVALAGLLARDEVRQLAFGSDCAAPPRRPEIEPLPAGRALEVLTVPFFERFAAAARRELGPRGGPIRVAEGQEFISAIRAGNFDLATVRPPVWPPLMATLSWRTGAAGNMLGYSNSAVDAALDARDWKAAQRALDADPPAAYVCTHESVIVLDARIRTPDLEAGRFMESLPQWEVVQ
jgi:hypothetical protein